MKQYSKEYDFDELAKEVLRDPHAKLAYEEHNIRRKLADKIRQKLQEKNLTIEDLAQKINCCESDCEVKKLLEPNERDLSFNVVFRAARVLGIKMNL